MPAVAFASGTRVLPVDQEALARTLLAETVSLQVDQARTAQVHWASKTLRQRLAILTALRLKMACQPREIAASVGRVPIAETLAAEVLPLLDACRFLELEAPQILRKTQLGNRARPKWLWGTSVTLRPEPLGIVLVIGPANYPLLLPGIQILQAIAAGNSVLVKPATNSTFAMQSLVDLAESVGLPRCLIQVLPEEVQAATQAIRARVNKVFLTGSSTTGQAVSRELAESTTPAVMELSGCDAVFVLDDADLELVSDCLLFGLMLNGGQTCMAPRRVLASESIADQLLPLLLQKLQLREARESSFATNPRAFPRECRSVSFLAAERIAAAVSAGAVQLTGSIEPDGERSALRGVAILDRVTADMEIVRSDLFAPILSFLRVPTEDLALQEYARCPYVLSATVFGTTARSQEFARRIDAGCVVINDIIVPTADPRVPFGGRQQSGHGVTRGAAGLLEMTQLKVIISSRRWFKPHLELPTPADADVLEQLIRIEHTSSPWKIFAIIPRLIKATLAQLQFRKSHGGRGT